MSIAGQPLLGDREGSALRSDALGARHQCDLTLDIVISDVYFLIARIARERNQLEYSIQSLVRLGVCITEQSNIYTSSFTAQEEKKESK